MKTGLAILMVCIIAATASAYLIDDFEDGDLSEYTQNVVLDQDTIRSVGFFSPGSLYVTKYEGYNAEQVLLLREDHPLGVGETLRVDTLLAPTSDYVDFGLAVAATPDLPDVPDNATGDVRSDYIAVYLKCGSSSIGYIAFDGPTRIVSYYYPGNVLDLSYVTGLLITRVTDTLFYIGFSYVGYGDILLDAIEVTNADIGNAVGFYTDVRANTDYGTMDNLRIVPEPATLGLLAFGAISLLRRRK